jgi:hypothetical protein
VKDGQLTGELFITAHYFEFSNTMSQKFHKKYDSIACKNLKDAKDILKAIETVEDEVSHENH